jgi:2-methylisocitrate lyase-like PEP mutase family enzyme
MPEQAEQAERLRALHHGADMLVLPNAWDAGSALLVERAGFPAVATSSSAVARARGWEDGEQMPVDVAFAAVAEIARPLTVPVTADMESGYGLAPAEFAQRLLEAGAVGCNYEDTDHANPGGLLDAGFQAERIAVVAQAGVVVNARVDTFVRGVDNAFDEGVRRARLYVEAGATCVYPIVLEDEALIEQFVAAVDAPVNILVRPTAPSLARLRQLGVRRASVGGGLYVKVMKALAAEVDALKE